MNLNNLVNYQSAPFNGPFATFGALLSAADAAPYEGIWMPTRFIKHASLEFLLAGTNPTAQVDLWASNAENPLNTYLVTLGGSVQASDVVALSFKANAGLPSAGVSIPYTVQGGDTLTTIATALAALVNANAILFSLGIMASSALGVITITWPSIGPNSNGQEPSSPPKANTLLVTAAVTGSTPPETATVSGGTDGYLLQSITQPGLISAAGLPLPVGSMKARLSSITGTGAQATLRLNGAT